MFRIKQVGRLPGREIIEQVETALEKEINGFASDGKLEIVQRTLGGKDREGKSFKPYSPGYLAYRLQKGRGAQVNLQFTGRMLQAVNYKVEKLSKKWRVTYSLSTAKEALKALRNKERGREFLGFDKPYLQEITDRIRKAINSGIRK